MTSEDLDAAVETAFGKIAGGGVRIAIELPMEGRTITWPSGLPPSGSELLRMHGNGEARVRFDFPEGIEEKQTAWPADCPYSEEELRRKIREHLAELLAFERRMQAFLGSLPDLPLEAPETIYEQLYWAACILAGQDALDYVDAAEKIERQLTLTAAQLRREWLSRLLGDRLSCLLPPEEPQDERKGAEHD